MMLSCFILMDSRYSLMDNLLFDFLESLSPGVGLFT